MVDKNLFLHDLAVVAILKNEGAYLKEWLDYHLLAGVDHFYLYDNDSTDNQREVAAPYVKAGLVDYIHAPGKFMQYAVYNDAIKRFKFFGRHMAFIDADEFIFPKTSQSIAETLDEILSLAPEAAGVMINWQSFGSNGQEKADYSRGVLERFTRRAPVNWSALAVGNLIIGNLACKIVINPRLINFIDNAHYAFCFNGLSCINSDGIIDYDVSEKKIVAADKIVVNHYYVKSREEYVKKISRGAADHNSHLYSMKNFEINDRNEEFDDGILRYRAARAENFSLPDDDERFKRVAKTLTEIFSAYVAGKKFSMETALTCRALSAYLLEKFPDNADRWKVYEETAFAAILNSLDDLSLLDAHMLIRELPQLLCRPYPAAKSLREVAFQIINQLSDLARINKDWQFYVELNYLQDFFGSDLFDRQ